MRMLINITEIKSNPFRDFDLYPIDDEQVERLRRSIHDLGFFSGLTARPAPDGKGYELAAGHHRLAAAKAEGLKQVEAVVNDYDDADMVAIMVRENVTQRGYNAAAVLDSVAAQAKLTAYAVFVSENFDENGPHVSKILETSGLKSQKSLDTAKALIAKDGPGLELIYRAINGFDRADRKANKDVETLKSTEIDEALASLKSSGEMGKIVAEAHAMARVILDQAEAEAEAARLQAEAEAKRKEEARKAEVERKAAEEAEAKKKADAARKAAERADAARKAEAERKAAEAKAKADALAEERKAAAKQAEADRKEREKQAEADRKEREKQAAARKAEADAVKAQKELEAVYDIRCMAVFRLTSHEKAFREGMLSENGRRFIPKEKQFELAQTIRAEIDATEKKRSMDLGSTTVKGFVDAELRTAMGMQKEIDEAERLSLLMKQDYERIMARWTTMRRGLQQAESALKAINEEQKKWNYSAKPFPVDHDALLTLQGMTKAVAKLSKELVGDWSA